MESRRIKVITLLSLMLALPLSVKALHRIMATYDGVSWVVFQEVETCRTCLNHINWGWNGIGNGYFYGWVYNPNNSFTYDSGCSSPNAPAYSYINDYRYFTVTH